MGHCWFTDMETCSEALRFEKERERKQKVELDSRKRILKAETGR